MVEALVEVDNMEIRPYRPEDWGSASDIWIRAKPDEFRGTKRFEGTHNGYPAKAIRMERP